MTHFLSAYQATDGEKKMLKNKISASRRNILKMGALSLGVTTVSTALGQSKELCGLTPAQTKGPFYPIKDQPDKDSDLTFVQGQPGKASGQEIFVQGIVTDQTCVPLSGALVEIWQACSTGKYNHPNDPNTAPLDRNFQYWGRAITNVAGQYRFKTILPGAYPADTGWVRPPHIHFRIQKIGYAEMITQLYFEGQALNAQDRILMALPINDRKKVVVPLMRVPNQSPGSSLVANFNVAIRKIAALK
jgi:protocatechuate 3,4-dioxygenase, beta subunit